MTIEDNFVPLNWRLDNDNDHDNDNDNDNDNDTDEGLILIMTRMDEEIKAAAHKT